MKWVLIIQQHTYIILLCMPQTKVWVIECVPAEYTAHSYQLKIYEYQVLFNRTCTLQL